MMLELLATLAAGLFSGASIYINLVEHPARMQCGTVLAIAQWGPSYKRATVMQAGLAAIGLLSTAGAWMLGAEGSWLIGGLLLGLVIAFTLIVILPIKSKACYTGPCQGISGYSATTRSLGQITCGPKRFELQFVPGFPVLAH
jgi:Domain of unknown function (DUF1772)